MIQESNVEQELGYEEFQNVFLTLSYSFVTVQAATGWEVMGPNEMLSWQEKVCFEASAIWNLNATAAVQKLLLYPLQKKERNANILSWRRL